MSNEPNPYAPPKYDGPAASGDPALEAIRREHINAETNIKTVGFLCYLATLASFGRAAKEMVNEPVAALLSVVMAGLLGWGGYQLRCLNPRGRVAYTVVAGIVVVRTVFFGVLTPAVLGSLFWPLILLAVLWTEKAGTVMTPHYRDVVIPGTPNVKRTTSGTLIVLVVILLALIALIIVAGGRS